MEKILNEGGVSIVLDLVNMIHEKRAYLGEIDGAIGDGDHGVNMDKGFQMAAEQIQAEQVTSLSGGLITLGRTLIMDIGGSMGPLYGTFFREMGKQCKNLEQIGKEEFGEMLQAAYTGLRKFDKAQVGDKTLQDTLVPALAAYESAVETGKDFSACLRDMENAAEKGWLSTKDMVAKIGRASRLGERSRGVLDAGATSCYLILQTLQTSICEKLQSEE